MHTIPPTSDLSAAISLSPHLKVRLIVKAPREGAKPSDFLVYVVTAQQELAFELPWSQLICMETPCRVPVQGFLVEITAIEMSTLEREGWLRLIAQGVYPAKWRSSLEA